MRDYERQAKLLTAGEGGMVVEFGCEISPALGSFVHQLTRLLSARKLAGVLEIVPTYRSVSIYFDPLVITRQALAKHITEILAKLKPPEADDLRTRIVHVPVSYGGVLGPELEVVARHAGLLTHEVIEIHTAKPYLVYMLGFIPGFPYLGGLSPKLYIPRIEKPRAKVPAGSVGIGGNQTGFYPIESQGEWWLIGRTPLRVFNPESDQPFLVAAGDYVQFFCVSLEEYFTIRRAVQAGTYAPDISFK
jgi:inhibitor of KinA